MERRQNIPVPRRARLD